MLILQSGHMYTSKITPKVPCIGIFAVIVFNKLGKHTHTLNKTVGIKATKRQCQKTSNLGGTHKFWPRIVYNDMLLMSQSEMDAGKNTALKWFAYTKAFKKLMKRNLMHRHWEIQWLIRTMRSRPRAFLVGMLHRKLLHVQLRSARGMLRILVPLTQVWLIQILFNVRVLILVLTKNCKQMQQKLIGEKVLVSLCPCAASVLVKKQISALANVIGR